MTLFRTVLKTVPASMTLLLTLFAALSLQAIEVTTTADENGENPEACSLREAVTTLNEGSSFGGCTLFGVDTVVALGAGVHELSLDLGSIDAVQVREGMTIRGEGPGVTVLEPSGAFADDLLVIDLGLRGKGIVTVEGLTLRGATGESSSAIFFRDSPTGSDLVLRDLEVRENTGDAALRVAAGGPLGGQVALERVVFESNKSTGVPLGPDDPAVVVVVAGGAMRCESDANEPLSLSLLDVLFRDNRAASPDVATGGGLASSGCDLTLTRVTFDGNTATSDPEGESFGGALALAPGPEVALANVTFFDNAAATGGALFLFPSDGADTPVVPLTNVTFADNGALTGGHIFQAGTAVRLRNVLFGPSLGQGCAGDLLGIIFPDGGNMDFDGTCEAERTEGDPGLSDRLAPRGGFVPTLSLVPGSAAIDAGVDPSCPLTDARGAPRPIDGDGDDIAVCDIGAFEADLPLFADGFESGDTSAWSATVD